MSTPSDLQRLASVVRATFPAPIAVPFFASTEPGGDAELPGLLSAIIRYLALIHLRAYLGGEGVESAALEERLSMLSQPAPDGRWLALLKETLKSLEPRPDLQPDPILLEILGPQNGLDLLEDAVRLRNLAVHEGDAEASPQLRRTIGKLLGCLLPLRFHRLIVPREVTATSPVPVYRAIVHQGYTRPFQVLRLRTDRVLSLDSAYLVRPESSRLLPLSPFLAPHGETLGLFSHRSGASITYWDPSVGKTFEDEAGRLELETLRKRLGKESGFLEARQLHLEGDALIARRLLPGAVIGGRYEVTAYLRSGGMADVYEARDQESDERVAVKMLPLELTRDTATLGRFLREVGEVRKVDHPRVVRYRDHGEDAGDRYLVLELATGWSGRAEDGGTAIDLGDIPKPLPREEVLQLAESVAEGLHEIHGRGLYHRDLKPGNVLLFEDEGGRRAMKLSDFGISARGGGTQYTLTGFFVGTPEYMSPEQADPGEEVGPESDIYSLGVILYECLTGNVPFRGQTPFATLEMHRTRRPEWPLRKDASISPGLANLAMKCLHKDPRKRYRSARDLLADLRRFQEDPAGHQEISVVRAGEDLGDLVLGEEVDADAEGTVFSATQPSTGKTLRARVFSSAISGDAAEREQVLVRMKRLAEAHRPGLPLIVGSGEARGVPYVVLEPVRGEPVGKLPPREAACAVADLGRAAAALHARGVLHGRVEKALARRDGERTSFADFGWRAAALPANEAFEESRRAEVRALGAVLHEVLTGSPPGERTFDPRREEPRTPAPLAAICRRALHPAEGYRTAGELVDDLECFLGSRPLAHALPSTPAYVMRLFLARHRVALLGGGAALFAAFLAAAAGFWWRPPAAPSLSTSSLPRMISAFKGSSWAASFSPDGRRTAFLNDASGVPQVWVRDLDGGQPAQVTHGDFPAERPRWSPDGEVIVFARNEGSTASIWSIPAPPATDTPRKIIDSGFNPCWSWDGKRLVFERPNEIWTANAHGGDLVKVLSLAAERLLLANSIPTPSPDGSSILYFQPEDGPKGRYWLTPVRGGPARPLTAEVTFGGVSAWIPPHGDSIVFPSDRSGPTTLWSVPAGGGPAASVTTGSGEDSDPEVSRDGSRLIYTNTRVTFVLRVTDLKTGEGRELWRLRSRMVGPVFSPDGSRITFFSDTGGTSRINVIESDGKSPPRQISQGKVGADIFPRWSPDGASIYYYQVRPFKSFRRMSSEGGESVEIARGWEWETHGHAAVDPSERWVAYAQMTSGAVRATWIRDMATGAERKLNVVVDDLSYSRDGQTLLGTQRTERLLSMAISSVPDGPILLCFLDGRPPRQLATGFFPAWSADGMRAYFLRNLPSQDGAELRSVSLETAEEKSHATLRPMWMVAPFVDISSRDEVAWVEREEGARELWLMDLGP